MAPLTGTYNLVKSENFDEYMAAIGVNWALRKLASAARTTTVITKAGDTWNIKTATTFKTTEISFRLGEDFKEVTGDGRHCESNITMMGDSKMVHVQRCGGPPLTILREFSDNGAKMKMTLEAPGNVKSYRYYEKVA